MEPGTFKWIKVGVYSDGNLRLNTTGTYKLKALRRDFNNFRLFFFFFLKFRVTKTLSCYQGNDDFYLFTTLLYSHYCTCPFFRRRAIFLFHSLLTRAQFSAAYKIRQIFVRDTWRSFSPYNTRFYTKTRATGIHFMTKS